MIRRFFAAATGRWAPFVYAVSLVAVVVGVLWYTNYVDRQGDQRYRQYVRDSERQWCAILDVLTAGPTPTTERGRVIAVELAKLRKGFDC